MRSIRSASLGIISCASLVIFASTGEAQAPTSVQPATATSDSTRPMDRERRLGQSVIRQAQEALKSKGYDPGPADGVLGPRTQAVLKEYQQAESLPVTSRLDQATSRKLGLQGDKRGAAPGRVREVQKALVETGYDPGPVDGRLGPRTKAALRRYASVPPPQAPTAAQEIIARFSRGHDRGQSP